MIKLFRLLLLKQQEAALVGDMGVTAESLERGRTYLEHLTKVYDKKAVELRKVRARISLLEDTRSLVNDICSRNATR